MFTFHHCPPLCKKSESGYRLLHPQLHTLHLHVWNEHSHKQDYVRVVIFTASVYILHPSLMPTTPCAGGTRWCSWLRHCARSQKVASSIPDGVTGIFHWHNPSSCTMALQSTQLLTEISTRNISCEVNSAGALGWQPYHLRMLTV